MAHSARSFIKELLASCTGTTSVDDEDLAWARPPSPTLAMPQSRCRSNRRRSTSAPCFSKRKSRTQRSRVSRLLRSRSWPLRRSEMMFDLEAVEDYLAGGPSSPPYVAREAAPEARPHLQSMLPYAGLAVGAASWPTGDGVATLASVSAAETSAARAAHPLWHLPHAAWKPGMVKFATPTAATFLAPIAASALTPAPYHPLWEGASPAQMQTWAAAPPLLPLNLTAAAKATAAAQASAAAKSAAAAAAARTVPFASLKKALVGAAHKAPVGLGVPLVSFLVFAYIGYKAYLHNQLEEEEIDEAL